MPEPTSARTRSFLGGLLLVLAATAGLLAYLGSGTDGLYGYDGWFHIRYAEILRTEGPSRSFPWWQETFLKDRWADKDFLYHVALIPFTFGDLVTGGKWAAIVFGALAMGAVYATLHALRVPWPAAWALGLLGSSTAFLYRLGFTRPLVAAVALAVAGTGAILLDRRRAAFALAAVYPHLHISFHLLPCVALVHDWHRGADPSTGRRSFRLSAWTWSGAALGALLSPYVPNNLYLWWVQNVRVLGMAWGGPDDLRMGLEIRPGGSDQLLKYNIGVFIAMALAIYALARARRRPSSGALTLLVIAGGFFGLSMLSRRFIEFWAPFTFILAGVAVRDALARGDDAAVTGAGAAAAGIPAAATRESPAPGPPRHRARRLAAAAAGTAIWAALLAGNARTAYGIIERNESPLYRAASEWMRANVPAGETIFHLDWDDFPELFFFNPQFRYLVGLDPTFMYLTSPERWRLWSDVAHANVTDLHTPIRRTFGSRWVFGIPEAEGFLEAARRDPRFFVRYEDDRATVFFVADGFVFVETWKVTGWWANPSRRLFDAALGPEPAAGRVAPGGAPSGPAAAGVPARPEGGYLDLVAATSLPPIVDEACAVAEATLAPEQPVEATLGISTGGEFRLYVNGDEVIAHSPLLNPPPGTPGGPPASLDDLLASRPSSPERTATAQLRAGPNALVVKVCGAGAAFGFYLRVQDGGGRPIPESSPPEGAAGRR